MPPSLDHLQEIKDPKQLRNSFTYQYIKCKSSELCTVRAVTFHQTLSQEFVFPRPLILAEYFSGIMYGSFVVCCLMENEWKPLGSFILLSGLGFELWCQKRKSSALAFNSNPLIIRLATPVPCCMNIFSAIEPSSSFGESIHVGWFWTIANSYWIPYGCAFEVLHCHQHFLS